MEDIGNRILLESNDADGYLLEDGSGVLLLESAPLGQIQINNYEFVRASDGISVTEKIR